MKKLALFIVTTLLLTSCDKSGRFDGEYSCKFTEALNKQSIRNGGRYFHPDTRNVKVIVKDDVFTVYGLSDGEYISSAMKKATDKDKEGLDEEEKSLAKDAMINSRVDGIDVFSPGQGMFAFAGVSNGNEYGQELSNCIKCISSDLI